MSLSKIKRNSGIQDRGKITQKSPNSENWGLVDQPGFEPRQTEPKSVVLPLHHWSIRNCGAKLRLSGLFVKSLLKKFSVFFL
jgi:hypothetical protein